MESVKLFSVNMSKQSLNRRLYFTKLGMITDHIKIIPVTRRTMSHDRTGADTE